VADVGSPEQLAAHTSGRYHVVLRFPSLGLDEKVALIGRLSAALPEFSVFDSGGLGPVRVTIMPVVARARVRERRAKVLQAIADYRRACVALVEAYRAGTLVPDWRTAEHGGHCRFESRQTGQVVEAPFREWVDPDWVDPFFFAQFVKTTLGLEPAAELIDHNFHDARRILEVMAAEAELTGA
jgi:hypothetical protein